MVVNQMVSDRFAMGLGAVDPATRYGEPGGMVESGPEVRGVFVRQRVDTAQVIAEMTSQSDFDPFDRVVEQSAELSIAAASASNCMPRPRRIDI